MSDIHLKKSSNDITGHNWPATNDNDIYSRISPQQNTKVWSVGGGKGGVGKSLVTANISICLALMGYKVIAIDLDLGGANLHTCLGIPIPEKTLSDYINKKIADLNDLCTQTPIKDLKIISGAQDDLGIANLKSTHKYKLLNKVRELDADFVILDLGAGTSFHTLDFFIAGENGILTVLPEPTSIENTYRFIKSFFFRRLEMIEDFLELGPLIKTTMNQKLSKSNSPVDLLLKIEESNPKLGGRLRLEVEKICPKLIVNQVRNQADMEIGHSMKIICKKYFGINLDYLGHLEYDPAVWQSVKKRRPLLMEFPNSNLVTSFDRIVHRLIEQS